MGKETFFAIRVDFSQSSHTMCRVCIRKIHFLSILTPIEIAIAGMKIVLLRNYFEKSLITQKTSMIKTEN